MHIYSSLTISTYIVYSMYSMSMIRLVYPTNCKSVPVSGKATYSTVEGLIQHAGIRTFCIERTVPVFL